MKTPLITRAKNALEFLNGQKEPDENTTINIRELCEAVISAGQILDSYSHDESKYGCGEWLSKYSEEEQ